MIKTFRGILADGEEERIRLSTKKGKVGYRIIKFQLFPNLPGTSDYEALVKIFKVSQATVPVSSGVADFSDGNLLACGLYVGTSTTAPSSSTLIFEQEVFNQDVFITHTANSGSGAINYYVELETITMTDNQAVVSTLRDIRLNPAPE